MDAPYLLVGNGRLSRHLQHYLGLEGLPWRLWSRSSPEPLEHALAGARAALLLIPDDAILPFLEQHADPSSGPTWIHCSGSLSTPLAAAAHPLMTFGDELYEHEVYRRVPFIGDRSGPSFAELFPGLPNPHFAIEPASRPLYHAACVMAGNLSTLLWQHAFAIFEGRLGLPRHALFPYLERVADNLQGSSDPLTGPLARGDERTIERHLAALDGDPFQPVYASFVAAHREAPRREER